MAYKIFAAGLAQAVSPDQMKIIQVTLIAGSANATASVKGNGVEAIPLAAVSGTMGSFMSIGELPFIGYDTIGPVTIDVVGSGAKVRIDF